jgi:hypothetical protein
MPELHDVLEQLALAGDRLVERALGIGERMAAARLGEALDERVVLCLEDEQADVHALGLQAAERARQLRERRAAARIDRDRHALIARIAQERDGLEEQRRREVVDAVEARVLEDVQRDALAGAGEAADDHQLHDRGSIAEGPGGPQTKKARAEHAPCGRIRRRAISCSGTCS